MKLLALEIKNTQLEQIRAKPLEETLCREREDFKIKV